VLLFTKKKGTFGNYKFSKKLTGLCHLCCCEKKWLEKFYTQEQIEKFKEKHGEHKRLKDEHEKGIKEIKENMNEGDVFVTGDFKRNLVISNFGAESSQMFQKREEKTLLGFELNYFQKVPDKDKGNWIHAFDMCMSNELKHNADNTIYWLDQFLDRLKSFYKVEPKRLFLFFDGGKHFKNNLVVEHLRKRMEVLPYEALFYGTYPPYHGKTGLDQCFSTVGGVFHSCANIPTIEAAVEFGNTEFKRYDKNNEEYNSKNSKRKKTIHNVTFFNVDPPKTNHEEDEIHMKIDAITKIFFFKFEKMAKKENEKEISVDMKMYETAGKYLQNVTMKNEVKNKPVANEKQKIEKKKKIKFKKNKLKNKNVNID